MGISPLHLGMKILFPLACIRCLNLGEKEPKLLVDKMSAPTVDEAGPNC